MTYLLTFVTGFVVTMALTRRFPGLVDRYGRLEDKVVDRIRKSCRNT